jgi:NAD(P)-dependent dehydrogenase (short-subunit alcohol dehydrogenase family)
MKSDVPGIPQPQLKMDGSMSEYLLDLTKEFAGRRALVTGGSRGIGAATAQRLIDGGASVVVAARNPHAETPKGATFISGDTRTLEGAQKVAKEAIAALGGLDILVNSAGAARLHLPASTAISDEEWVDSLNVNFLSALRITYASLDELVKTKGSIVNVTSGGRIAFGGPMAHYGAAKAALNNWSESLAKELAPKGVRVNIVSPGPIITPGGDEVRKTITEAMGITDQQFFSTVPLEGRAGTAQELAEAITFLVSQRASYITGDTLFVGGGWGTLAAI